MTDSLPITVVIPVGPYPSNRKWLDQAINSVHGQTIKVDEILLINDSFEPLEKQNVNIWNSPWRLGVAHAFNFGVALASNELVFMLGSDDFLTPDCLEECYKCWLKNKKSDAYYWVSLQYLGNKKIQNLPCNAAMVTKGLWMQTGGFPIETACGQPDGTFISMMMVHRPADLIPVSLGHPLYKYRWHKDIDTLKHSDYWEATMFIRKILTERGFE